jgi:hypothetical protein
LAPDFDRARAHRPGASEDRSGHRAPHSSYPHQVGRRDPRNDSRGDRPEFDPRRDEVLSQRSVVFHSTPSCQEDRTECLIFAGLADPDLIAIEEPCSPIPQMDHMSANKRAPGLMARITPPGLPLPSSPPRHSSTKPDMRASPLLGREHGRFKHQGGPQCPCAEPVSVTPRNSRRDIVQHIVLVFAI